MSVFVTVALAGVGITVYSDAARAAPWCGGTPGATDRIPDAAGGNQFHVIYVIPADGVDRFSERAAAIASDLQLVDSWWRGQDPTRTPRFDMLPVECTSLFGRLDISSVRATQPAAAFIPPANRFTLLTSNLGLTSPSPHKKLLAYFDSPVPLQGNVCGEGGNGSPSIGGLGSGAAIYLSPNLRCGTVGAGDYLALVAAHELIHSLGALPSGAPHPCAGDPGHPCDSPRDILYPGGTCCLFDRVLDFGRDDYYGHSGPWWDVRDSKWLSHLDEPPSPLTVKLVGDVGESDVQSDLPGISCPPGCTVAFDSGETVTLTAQAGIGRDLIRWEGDCTAPDACSLPMGGARSVTAVFARERYHLSVRVTGIGHVTSSPRGLIACPRRCTSVYTYGTSVRLIAHATARSRFVTWRGDCVGRTPCVVQEEAHVTAVFAKRY